jgi:hypothetical protein
MGDLYLVYVEVLVFYIHVAVFGFQMLAIMFINY